MRTGSVRLLGVLVRVAIRSPVHRTRQPSHDEEPLRVGFGSALRLAGRGAGATAGGATAGGTSAATDSASSDGSELTIGSDGSELATGSASTVSASTVSPAQGSATGGSGTDSPNRLASDFQRSGLLDGFSDCESLIRFTCVTTPRRESRPHYSGPSDEWEVIVSSRVIASDESQLTKKRGTFPYRVLPQLMRSAHARSVFNWCLVAG